MERAGSAVELRPAPKAGRGTDCARPGALDMRRWRCVASGIVNQNGRRFEVLTPNRNQSRTTLCSYPFVGFVIF